MLLTLLFGALVAFSVGLAIVAIRAQDGWSVVSTIFAAIVGGLISAIGQEAYRREEGKSREQDLIAALRSELEHNIKIRKTDNDEKWRAYSTSAWEAARSCLINLKPEVAAALHEGYVAAYMHGQARQLELIRNDQGQALISFSYRLETKFTEALGIIEWRKTA